RPPSRRARRCGRRAPNASRRVASRVSRAQPSGAPQGGADEAAMLIYGFHSVLARLRRAPGGIRGLYVDANRDDARARDLVRAANDAGVRAHFVDAQRIARLCPGKRHQGVVAIVDEAPAGPTLEELLDAHGDAP